MSRSSRSQASRHQIAIARRPSSGKIAAHRSERASMRLRRAAFALAILAAMPAEAGQSGAALDLWSPATDLPRADSGKPLIFTPPSVVPKRTDDCPRAMPCGLRLLGTVQRNGAVELRVPALQW
jgi:hypothetical protein